VNFKGVRGEFILAEKQFNFVLRNASIVSGIELRKKLNAVFGLKNASMMNCG
jgi:hypothetical protein